MVLSLDEFRSPTDSKHYRVFTLANGLEVMLVQNEAGGANSDADANTQHDGAEPDPEPAATAVQAETPVSSRARRYSFFSTASDEDNDDDDASMSDGGGADERGVPASTCHAAACMTVSVGSMADPPDLRGLAHYLEHMLFMGSVKYPDENEFEAFLATHGGYSNGATEGESTRFLFEVSAQHLAPALDMFAQFFVAPLFKHEALERELRAVESEFNRAMQNDYVRLQQIQCETCAPGHAYDSFSWGNAESLQRIPAAKGIDVRDAMIAFYERHYAPSAMKLCVYGHDSLDVMEQWVTESFSTIPVPKWCSDADADPDSNAAAGAMVADLASPPPFGAAAGQDPVVIKVVPVSKMHAMHLYWPLPPLFADYQQKPCEYLAHVLGHEGVGSLTSVLKRHGWGTYVTAGVSESDSYECGSFGCLFEVGVTLTREGVAHWADVVHAIFDVVHFTRHQRGGLPAWIFDELKASTEIAHMFQEEPEPITLCKRMSHLLQRRYGVARSDLLRYDTMQGDFDETRVRAVLDAMTPANTRVVLFSHAFEEADADAAAADADAAGTWRTERWIGAKYTATPITRDVLAQWQVPMRQDELRNPCRNPFMPQSFRVLASRASTSSTTSSSSSCCGDDVGSAGMSMVPLTAPELVHTTAMSKLWFKQDDTFFVPKTNAHFLLCLPSLTQSVSHYVCAVIYIKLVNDALKQAFYQASNANLSFDVDIRDLDVEVTFAGFSDTLGELVRVVFDAVVATPIAPTTFALMRDELAREYRNVNLKPAMKARYLRLQLLERSAFAIEDKIRVLTDVTLADVERFRDSVMWSSGSDGSGSGIALRSLVHGNCTEADAIALQSRVEQLLQTRMQQTCVLGETKAHAMVVVAPLVPRTPTRPHTTELPLTANGILLRDMSEHDDETNSAVEVYYQLGKCSYAQHAYASLLHQIMQEPLFHALRTQQQLGYEVYCCVRDTHGVLGFSIAVQSASHASGDIAVRIDKFVHDDFLAHLRALSDEQFARHVATLQRLKARAAANLAEETYRYWDEIQSRRLDFAATREVVSALSACTLAGLIECYHTWLLATPGADSASGSASVDSVDGARKLRVHVVGKSSHFVPLEHLVARGDAPQIVKNLREYKKALRCHC